MPDIQFFTEEIEFTLPNPIKTRRWIRAVVEQHQKSIESISYVFCSDEYLLNLNRQLLDHDYYTDIITVPLSEADAPALMADLFISIDRVRENAETMGIPFRDELHRVMIHGVLHLLGYDDHNDTDIAAIRQAETSALAQR